MTSEFLKKASAICLCALLLTPVCCSAKSGWYARFDNAIRRFLVAGLDTTYIAAAPMSWEVPAMTGIYGNDSQITLDDGSKVNIGTDNIPEAGIGIGYHGLDYVQKFNLGGRNTFTRYFEFDYYDNYWGAQIITSGQERDNPGIGISSLTLGGYFAFNGKRYSYPAVYYGNYRQLRSAGSAILFFWYDHIGAWDLDRLAVPVLKDRKDIHDFTICGGYGYNWSFNKGRSVINATGGAGLSVPYWGFAAEVRLGIMHWLSDNFRINISSIQYFTKGWGNASESYFSTEWMASVGVAYCFGRKISE